MPLPMWSRTEMERFAAGVLGLAIAALLGAATMACAALQSRYGSAVVRTGEAAVLDAAGQGQEGVAGSGYSAVMQVRAVLPPAAAASAPGRATTTTTSPPAGHGPAPQGSAPPSPRQASAAAPGFGCPAAIAWLQAHAAPGFRFICPGYAMGHQAMTCHDMPGVCPGEGVIVIADPCPAAYENEAWNSLLAVGLATGAVDPYGHCP